MKNISANFPLSVHLLGTSRCNLSCSHCFVNTSSKNPDTKDIAAFKIIDLIQKIFKYNESSDIELEGGEILLHPEINKIIAGIPINCFPQLTITTNGTIPFDFSKILSPELLYRLQLRVSIEGHTQLLHEKIRNSSLSVIFKNLSQWVKLGINPIIRITLNSYNYHCIQEIVDELFMLGIKKIQFLEYQPCGRGAAPSNKHFLLREKNFKKVLFSLIDLKYPKNTFQISLNVSPKRKHLLEQILPLISKNYEIEEKKNTNSLTINWDESYSCCPWTSFEGKLGTIDYDIFLTDIKILASKNLLSHECDYCSKYTIKSKIMV
jgi:MoaA/NifB/PqqE/SkfB family radical SAM enzyme